MGQPRLGRHDAERLRRSRAALAAIAGLLPVAWPDPAAARRRADAAVAVLIETLLRG